MDETPRPGDVWDYPYLWAWQQARGETEGRKPRPVAVAVTIKRADRNTAIYLLPITTQPPREGRACLAVPETERRRAGLDAGPDLWIVLDEFNVDVAERAYYLHPGARLGAISPRFLDAVRAGFREVLRTGGKRQVRRHDE